MSLSIQSYGRVLLLGALSLVLWVPSALACGGFFCSNFPIDQAGEKILFHADGEKVTAVIQIQFEGESEDFSWVLPLPSAPDNNDEAMRIGSEELFVQLLARTSPTFSVEWEESECSFYGDSFPVPNSAFFEEGESEGPKSVEVLQVKEVGPYTASVVKSDDAEALSAWLSENGYDQPPAADPLIAYYVAQGNVFLALKLQQNKGAGDIAPIIVEFDEPQGPCIPLVLTAIAATPDMPVYAWIVGEERLAPRNFFHVGLNLAKIDWLSGGDNYIEVVTDAVNEAAGHGFVTDYAGKNDLMADALNWPGRFDMVEGLAEYTHPRDFYQEFINSGLPSNTQTLALLEKYIPVSPDFEGEDSTDFYNQVPWNEELTPYLDALDFDAAAFVAEIQEVIVGPIVAAQELLDSGPYMTRLFTTVSEDEMNRDPIFVAAAGMGDVPIARTATGTLTCGTGENGDTISSATITLEDGSVINISGPFDAWDSPGTDVAFSGGQAVDSLNAAQTISVIDDQGVARNIPHAMAEYEDSLLAFVNANGNPAPSDLQEVLPKPEMDSDDGCQSSGASLPLWSAMLLLGCSLLSRRKTAR